MIRMGISMLLLLFALFSCTGTVTQPVPESVLVERIEPEVKAGWELEWEKTLAMAKKQGNVTIYTTISPEVRDAWMKHFGEKFGIRMEFITGRSAEIREKLFTERRAGIYTGDLVMTGLTTIHLVLEPAGLLESFGHQLFLPEVIDSKAWYKGRLPWFSKEPVIFLWNARPLQNFWINTQLIKAGEITTYWDLLKPQWKGGKFLINDPTTSGSGSKWFEVYSREEFLGLDYMRALVKQEPVLLRDELLAANWVARGKYPFSIAIQNQRYEPFRSAGAPVDWLALKEPPLPYLYSKPRLD